MTAIRARCSTSLSPVSSDVGHTTLEENNAGPSALRLEEPREKRCSILSSKASRWYAYHRVAEVLK